MSKSQANTLDFVENETFLENSPKNAATSPKLTFIKRFFYSKGLNKNSSSPQQIEIADLRAQPSALILMPNSEKEPERMKWDSFSEYVLSIIGFVIDLGNVWRLVF